MTDFDINFPPLSPTASGPTGKESKEPDEDWELIATEDDDHAENDVSNPAATEKVPKTTKKVVVQGNPKILRHCTSSPDLRCFAHIFEEEEDEDHEEHKAEDSSFAMLSTPGSVISMASGRSFRDALGTSPMKQEQQSDPKAPSTVPRPFRKPKIVVAAPSMMRRCSQSSPNLLGLIQEDAEVLGETDAAEYYHRKAKGAQGRSNGLKLRPDEAKRKQYAVNKRDLQRQASLK